VVDVWLATTTRTKVVRKRKSDYARHPRNQGSHASAETTTLYDYTKGSETQPVWLHAVVSLTVILSSGGIQQCRPRQPCAHSHINPTSHQAASLVAPLGETEMGTRFDSHRFRADRSACTEVRGLALTTAHPRTAGSQAAQFRPSTPL
jgi:hypothetical protein